ncbi:hypothetical protein J2129_000041 [Methanofollis sp. W23]|uniref:WD40 repeat domain-containing protein n=1 Tax=Methanofollis sp. W23 TaxID=2817849 RepID=UPI001AE153D9|nr:WD40 repeat domain-containing protein [Methanofollis sp. W23]MBP2144587.1 hypothetical protein [Methanofollis sp. W23]
MHRRRSILWLFLLLLSLPAGVHGDGALWDHGVSSEIDGLAMTPDGAYVLVGGDRLRFLAGDGTHLWDKSSATYIDCAADGQTIARAKGYEVMLFAGNGTVLWQESLDFVCAGLALSPDGKWLAVAEDPGLVCFYDTEGTLRATVDTRGDPDDDDYDPVTTIQGIAFSGKGSHVAVVSTQGIYYYTGAGRKLWAHDDVLDGGSAVAVSRSGDEVAVASDAGIRLFDERGTLLWEEKSHRPITALAISPEGSRILAGSQDKLITCFDAAGTRLWEHAAGGWFRDIGVSENGSRVIAGSMDNQAYLFDGEGNVLRTEPLDGWVDDVAITADGTFGVAASAHRVIGFSVPTLALVETTVPPETTLAETPAPTTAPTSARTTASPTTPTPPSGPEEEGGGLSPLLFVGLLGGAVVLGGGYYYLKGRRTYPAPEMRTPEPWFDIPEEGEVPEERGEQVAPVSSASWEQALDEGDTREAAKLLSKQMTLLIEERTGTPICITDDALAACPEQRENLAAFFAMADCLGYAPKVPERGEVEVLVEVYRYLAEQITPRHQDL